MKRIYQALACVALVAVAVGLYMFFSPSPQTVKAPPYLAKANGETILPPYSRQEIQRRVVYGSDGFTRVRMVVYFVNGDTGVTLYHPDGSLDVYRYHPSETAIDWKAATLSDKGVKSLIEIAVDGRSFLSERHWDESGKLKRLGLRLPAGGYQLEGYFGDGAQISDTSLFTDKGALESRLVYWENGNLKSTLKQKSDGSSKQWAAFYQDGKKSGVHVVDGSNEHGEFYFEDGKTIRLKFSKESSWRYYSVHSVVTATYYNRDGSLQQTRTFEDDGMKVEYARNGSTPAFTQTWKMIDPKRTENRLAADNFKLVSVTISRYKGIDSVDLTIKEDGTVSEVRFVRKGKDGTDETVKRFLRDDGTVEKEQVLKGSGKTERTFTGDTGGRFDVPRESISRNAYEPPPTVPAPTTTYSYYDY